MQSREDSRGKSLGAMRCSMGLEAQVCGRTREKGEFVPLAGSKSEEMGRGHEAKDEF